ncbi:SRPBCC domain-containing protein [Streptomyces marincola]|uniref:Carbon monoxide dehydrogenase subunit G n=1 Tax=Streptomyces marincola TaxID=2878388 RepID=A0A1W7CY07_9ACTN|nr:SRPBCC domain-containing protein [Streptomyces marincola]ARQ69587.1 hypothetical protein CAG99_12560 [Streptomyces marincola]
MEHEVFLPYSADAVRRVFAAPERMARCVPGLHPDPETDPAAPAGRLRVRIGSSSITYRGSMTFAVDDGRLTVEARGTEARGDGEISLVLGAVAREEEGGGTTVAFQGTVRGEGRIGTFDAAQREAAGRRLLDRFAEALAEELADAEETGPDEAAPAVGGIGEPEDNERVIPGIPAAPEPEPEPGSRPVPGAESTARRADVPEPDIDFTSGADPDERAGLGGELGLGHGIGAPYDDEEDAVLPEPEADFARRTMIGRSAEEVDHAPPRGRYAPEPSPDGETGAAAALRWAAPAAALALATAVVLTRALRRRR